MSMNQTPLISLTLFQLLNIVHLLSVINYLLVGFKKVFFEGGGAEIVIIGGGAAAVAAARVVL